MHVPPLAPAPRVPQRTCAALVATIAGALVASALGGCLDVTHNDLLDERSTRALISPPRTVHADVALVLGCPADDDTGEASLCERCRVKSALRAYRDGEVSTVIFTGGAAHNRYIEAESMAALAERRGMPRSAMILEPDALTTWMNLRYSQRRMRARGLRTALVVSTAAHLPRARRFIDWFGIEAVGFRACDWEPRDVVGEWPIARPAPPAR